MARCSQYANATLLNDDVLGFEPEDRYSMIFLGGMLMYLNENDVIALLEKSDTVSRAGRHRTLSRKHGTKRHSHTTGRLSGGVPVGSDLFEPLQQVWSLGGPRRDSIRPTS